ncbi:hypothetical protein PV402_39950 [Streptomyces scabiei]|uniref:hypothetical protein n=1 Tax=Streptomyces scabiei TaxID=1930 RepID=UPI0029AEDA2D|nr:hypothetical protein [Streptomyces scabiei]MDX2658362.1 hypothetical protein [Streptomyces scabiei]MDX2870518.1 hypothetical protein [Streptomyces scabiei]
MTPDELADKLDRAATRIGPAVQKAVKHTGTLGAARIRGFASGRPGPNVINDDYRGSWKPAPVRRLPYGAMCTLGTRRPQGRRLEFGFVGVDSIGRHYDQKPFPHVQPALPFIGQTLRASMRLAVAEILL